MTSKEKGGTPDMYVRMQVLGGKTGRPALREIGASMYLLMVKVYGREYCYLIDAGMETNDDLEVSWRGPMDIGKLKYLPMIDAAFATHAHRDHVAAFCMKEVRSRLKPDAPLIATKTTAAFLPYVLHDQVKIAGKKGEKKPYGLKDIYEMTKRARAPITKPEILELVPGAISVLVWPAGHIRGACSYFFKIREGRKEVVIMFSGDYALHNQLSTMAAPLPPEGWYPDVIMSFDSTNGAEHLRPWKSEIERMADDGFAAVKAGSWFFTFAFAMDRCQTFASALSQKGLPVYLDGPSALELGKVMASGNGFWCEGDTRVDPGGVKEAEFYGEPVALGEPAAIVAPSGMGHGPAAGYLLELLGRENAVIGSSGYVARGTNGYRVVNAKRGDTVRIETGENKESVEVVVRARCEKYRATAHSLREDAVLQIEKLLAWSTFRTRGDKPLVGLHHGSTRAYDWFQKVLDSRFRTIRADVEKDRDIELID